VNHAATFAAVFAVLLVAHQVGDSWIQTHHQAVTKGQPGWVGRFACAAHVASYTVTAFAAIVVLDLCTGLRQDEWRVGAGLAVSAVTHYVADRRTPLLRLAELMQPVAGKADFYRLGAPRPGRDDNPTLGTGAYVLDQSFHHLWLFVAALIIA
jgi:uncharacterized MAPEG superfamily protein